MTLGTCLLTKSGHDRTSDLTTSPCLAEVAARHSEARRLQVERSVLKASRPTFSVRDGQRELTATVRTRFDCDSGAAVTTVHSPHEPENRALAAVFRELEPQGHHPPGHGPSALVKRERAVAEDQGRGGQRIERWP